LKAVSRLTVVILDIMIFIVLLFSALQVVVYNDQYFSWHYKVHHIEETTNMSIDELMQVTDKMMDYLIGKRDTLDMTAVINGTEEEVFGKREKAHMEDVKKLFLNGKQMRDMSAVFLVALLAALAIWKKDMLRFWLKQLKWFFIGSFSAIMLVGLLMASDFNRYFTLFHQLFFNNDLWLLDPRTDVLINMVPEIFFFQTAMLIIGVFIGEIILLLLIAKGLDGKLGNME